jgi:hypothetical protein
MPSEVRFAEVRRLVEQKGMGAGANQRFAPHLQRPDGTIYTIPVHNNRVKPFYVREIKKELKGD